MIHWARRVKHGEGEGQYCLVSLSVSLSRIPSGDGRCGGGGGNTLLTHSTLKSPMQLAFSCPVPAYSFGV
ncbi:unnamed protein product [Mesocestoides corti]|uniref:Uncharacterized protein n=1 Tax=Mesocestoides corti TaxID=53468 RepID=A0A0R3UQ66_MESCO|nr:unnamed protein product [Mesocestoides corti]